MNDTNTTAPKQPEAFTEAQRFQQYLLTQGIAIAPSKPIFNASPSRPKKRASKKHRNL